MQDDSDPYAAVLDQHMGLEVYSPVFSLLTADKPDVKEVSLIMQAYAYITTANGTRVLEYTTIRTYAMLCTPAARQLHAQGRGS